MVHSTAGEHLFNFQFAAIEDNVDMNIVFFNFERISNLRESYYYKEYVFPEPFEIDNAPNNLEFICNYYKEWYFLT